MADLVLYLGITLVGYFVGSRLRNFRDKITWTGKVQVVAIIILVLFMGMRMGSNKEVTSNLDSIGLYAFIMTVVLMVFSVAAIFIARKIIGINRFGTMEAKTEKKTYKKGEKADRKIDKMTIFIVVSVAIGMVIGYLFVNKIFSDYETFDNLAGLLIKIGLCLLLVFVGMDLGLDGTVVTNFKKVGLRILIFPIVTAIGTLAGALVCSMFIPVSSKEALAIGAGFGWYTLAPGIIMEAGFVKASAISFMHNVMRELFSIILIPVVAKKIGYVETTGMPGAAAMDICLPIVEKATSSNIAVYSFVSGVVLSIAVPVLVPLIIG